MESENNDKTGFNKYSILMFLISYNNPIRIKTRIKKTKNETFSWAIELQLQPEIVVFCIIDYHLNKSSVIYFFYVFNARFHLSLPAIKLFRFFCSLSEVDPLVNRYPKHIRTWIRSCKRRTLFIDIFCCCCCYIIDHNFIHHSFIILLDV